MRADWNDVTNIHYGSPVGLVSAGWPGSASRDYRLARLAALAQKPRTTQLNVMATSEELVKELASKNRRIAELEGFVSAVLNLSRYPWLHPELALEQEGKLVQDLLVRGWSILPPVEQVRLRSVVEHGEG